MNEIPFLESTRTIGIIVLAAGASVRMGTPKQLLKINGRSLVRVATENALDCGSGPVVVVLGANADLIASELNGLAVHIARNTDWKLGMSSSIHCGLKMLLTLEPQIQSAILFLGDQPNVTGNSLRRLTTAHLQGGSGLVAASYSGCFGTPALFTNNYFEDLLQLNGQGGAREILQRYKAQVTPVAFPEAELDLDTPQDFMEAIYRQELPIRQPTETRCEECVSEDEP